MRPVDRGDIPTDDNDDVVVFKEHGEARDYLVGKIGDFCSYCETGLHSMIAVEHTYPKQEDLYPERALDWDNFLLTCWYCNSIKGTTDVALKAYYWPHSDNTARAFDYRVDRVPEASHSLTTDEKQVAENTIELTGLDRDLLHPETSPVDRRWKKRKDAWGVAMHELRKLRQNDTPQLRDSIVQVAISRGFWSVWMQVFSDDQDMRQRLINWFDGTAKNCFDAQTKTIPRPGGQL